MCFAHETKQNKTKNRFQTSLELPFSISNVDLTNEPNRFSTVTTTLAVTLAAVIVQ